MLRRALIVAVLGWAPLALSAEPSWVGDFETGDVTQWSAKYDAQPGTTDRVSVVDSPVKQGRYALKTTVKHGDSSNLGNRAEVVLRDPMFHQGDEVWFHWYTLFPEDYQPDDRWVLFTQFHSNGFGFPLTFNVHGEQLSFRVMAHDYDARGQYAGGILHREPLVRGQWMEFLLHVKFSDGPDGFVALWRDGQQVVPQTPHQTLDRGDYVYLKQGIYRHRDIRQDMTLYHDGMTAWTERPEHLLSPPPLAEAEPPEPPSGELPAEPLPGLEAAAPEAPGVLMPPDGAHLETFGCGQGAPGQGAAALLFFPAAGALRWWRRRRG
jgi:hypothetical protein